MPIYFEKQVKKQCSLHALNNAMQSKFATTKDMDTVAETMASELARGVVERKPHRLPDFDEIKNNYISGLMDKETGFWSPSVTERLLKTVGQKYDVVMRMPELKNYVFMPNQTYIVSTQTNGYGHSVAVVNGVLLDSELGASVLLKKGKLPKQYTPHRILKLII